MSNWVIIKITQFDIFFKICTIKLLLSKIKKQITNGKF